MNLVKIQHKYRIILFGCRLQLGTINSVSLWSSWVSCVLNCCKLFTFHRPFQSNISIAFKRRTADRNVFWWGGGQFDLTLHNFLGSHEFNQLTYLSSCKWLIIAYLHMLSLLAIIGFNHFPVITWSLLNQIKFKFYLNRYKSSGMNIKRENNDYWDVKLSSLPYPWSATF